MPLFAELGYKVWAPNQRGYGKTTRPRSIKAYQPENLLQDVRNLIEASGCSSVTLVGHDWGGNIAWLSAIEGVPLERLIILDMPHPSMFAKRLFRRKQLHRSRYMFYFQLPWLPVFTTLRHHARKVAEMFTEGAVHKARFTDEMLEVYREAALQPGAMRAMLNWYRAPIYYGTAHYDVAHPPKLEMPTLMLWGVKDPAFGTSLTYGTERYVKDLSIYYLDAAHWVQWEVPETVNTIIEAWLTDKPVPKEVGVGRLKVAHPQSDPSPVQ